MGVEFSNSLIKLTFSIFSICLKLTSVRRPMADDPSSGLIHFEEITLESALAADNFLYKHEKKRLSALLTDSPKSKYQTLWCIG